MTSGKVFGCGSMNLKFPGSIIPLDLNYTVSEMDDTLYLSATTDWTVSSRLRYAPFFYYTSSLTEHGFQLREVSLGAEFDIKDPKSN